MVSVNVYGYGSNVIATVAVTPVGGYLPPSVIYNGQVCEWNASLQGYCYCGVHAKNNKDAENIPVVRKAVPGVPLATEDQYPTN